MSMYHGVDLAWCAGAHVQPDPQVVEGAALGGSEAVISAGSEAPSSKDALGKCLQMGI